MFTTVGMTEIDTPVLACEACGAVVWFELRETHAVFHARLAEAERSTAGA